MNDLLQFSEICRELRAESAPLKCRYPIEIRERAVKLSKEFHIEEVAFQLEVTSSSIYRWEKDLSTVSSGFTKVTIRSSHSSSKQVEASFEVVFNGNKLQFSSAPDPRWFAQLLLEVRP